MLVVLNAHLPFEMWGGMGDGHCLVIRFGLFTRLPVAESGLSRDEQRCKEGLFFSLKVFVEWIVKKTNFATCF